MAEIDCAVVKPHAIMVEFLFQGHINPFVNLAIALASKGCTITYVQTEFIHHQTRGAPQQLGSTFSEARESGLDIRELTISDGFPLDFDRGENFVEFYECILRDFPTRVDELVRRIVQSERGGGQLRPFLVADANYLWPPKVAAKYNLVYVSFWPSPALRLSIGCNLPLLQDNNASCSSYANAFDNYKDHAHEITGEKSRNERDFIKYAPSKDDPSIPEILRGAIIKSHFEVKKAHFILCNTVEELEYETISILNQEQHLPTYAIGPTNFLATSSISSSLRSEVDCTEWLSCKPPGSVLFIAFGSVAQTDKQVINELAHGLLSSRANFLWVLRPDTVLTGGGDVLPLGFEDEVSGRGLIVPWCDQCKVLSNPAVGGFLTHCGWSSILESVWFGVPMICYPISMDQPTNRNMVVYDWEIGINLCDKQQLCREEVVEKIDKLMSGTEVGEMMRMNMKKVKEIVHNALSQNGSSNGNLDKFLKDLKKYN